MQAFLKTNPKFQGYVWEYREALLCVYLTDLDPIKEILFSLYSHDKRGSQPHSPFCLVRSMMLMTLYGYTSIKKWAPTVQFSPVLSAFCGFAEGKAACKSTYYDFLSRIENGEYRPKCAHRVLNSEIRRKRPRLKIPPDKPKEKERKPQEMGVLKALLEKLRSEKNSNIEEDLEKRMNEILLLCAVKPSVERGIITTPVNLTASGDGSVVASGGSPYGKSTCECKKNGIYKCEHPRKFSDMDAEWGWDNSVKNFLFGYRYYQLVSASNAHDLPLYLSISSANTHEGVMFLKAMERWRKQNLSHLPSLKMGRIALDAIHDAYAIYEYLYEHNIGYAIPYAKTPGSAACVKDHVFTPDGFPICKGGLAMRHHGYNKQGHNVYACPVKRLARREGKKVYVAHIEECPLKVLCEPESVIGPLLSVSDTADLRLMPKIRRDSEEYKSLYDQRTCCERSNAMKKVTFGFKHNRMRTMPYVYIRLMIASVCEHSNAWAKDRIKSMDIKKEDILKLFDVS